MPTKLVAVEPVPLSIKRCWRFDECLREVVLGLRLLGIPLDPSGIRCPLTRYWSISFGRIMFVINLAVGLFIVVLPSMNTVLRGSAEMTMAKWNSFINQINFMILLLFGHVGILRYTAPHWNQVVSILYQIEQLDLLTDEDYKKIRIIILKGAAAFIFSIVVVAVTSVLSIISPSSQMDLNPIQLIFFCYILAGIFLFTALGSLVSSMLEILVRHNQITTTLDRWRRCYNLIRDLVDHLNDAFGLILFSLTFFYFIYTTNSCFLAWIRLRENGVTAPVLRMLAFLIAFLSGFIGILNVPNRIQREALNLSGRLRSIKSEDKRALQLAHQMDVEVAQLYPLHITALDVFNVDFSLIPKVIETAITYNIIMFQFKASER